MRGKAFGTNQQFQEYIRHISQLPQEIRKSVPKWPKNGKGAQIDNHVLLADIITLAEELGHPPNSREMDKHGPGKTQTYQKRFGSYPSAMKIVGFEPKFVSNRQKMRYLSEKEGLGNLLFDER